MFTTHALLNSIHRFLVRQSTIFHQFDTLNAVRLLCAELTRKVLDPYNIPSYSQSGEDRILCHILSETGLYVDVGCNHPQSYSNTYALYKRGWRGITIDANEKLVQKHQNLRKQDTSICAVISDKEQEVTFTDFEDSLVSSLDTEHIHEWKQSRTVKEERSVIAVSLNTIFKEHEVPYNFDLLSIDVEGHDFEVLCSIDLHIYRPKMIVVEMHGFDMLNPTLNKVHKYLTDSNYKMVGYIIMNGYFIDTSK